MAHNVQQMPLSDIFETVSNFDTAWSHSAHVMHRPVFLERYQSINQTLVSLSTIPVFFTFWVFFFFLTVGNCWNGIKLRYQTWTQPGPKQVIFRSPSVSDSEGLVCFFRNCWNGINIILLCSGPICSNPLICSDPFQRFFKNLERYQTWTGSYRTRHSTQPIPSVSDSEGLFFYQTWNTIKLGTQPGLTRNETQTSRNTDLTFFCSFFPGF